MFEQRSLAAARRADHGQVLGFERVGGEIVPNGAATLQFCGDGDGVSRNHVGRAGGDAQLDKDLLQFQGIGALGGQAFDVKVAVTVDEVLQVAFAVAGGEVDQFGVHPFGGTVHPFAFQFLPDLARKATD